MSRSRPSRQTLNTGREASLWNSIALSSVKSSLGDADLRGCISIDASYQVNYMRFVPIDLRHKSHAREFSTPKASQRGRYRFLVCLVVLTTEFIEVLKDRQRQDLDVPPNCAATIAALEWSVQEMNNKGSKDWAHRHCLTEHVCYGNRLTPKIKTAPSTV